MSILHRLRGTSCALATMVLGTLTLGTLAAASPAPAAPPVTAPAGWAQEGYGPGNTGDNPAESALTVQSVKSLRHRFAIASPPLFDNCEKPEPPVVAGGRLFIGDVAGLGGYDAHTGARLWHAGEAQIGDINPPILAVVGNTLLAATIDCGSVSDPGGALYALDATTGHVLWHRSQDPPMDQMAVEGGTAVVSGGSPSDVDTVTGYRISDGAVLWTRTGVQMKAGVSAGGRLLLTRIDKDGSDSGSVAVGTATGTGIWSRTGRFSVVAADPTGARFYADSTAGNLVALDAATGAVAWTVKQASGSLAATPGRVYVAHGPYLTAIGDAAGTVLWTKDLLGQVRRPTVAGGLLYVLVGDDLRIFDAASGAQLPVSADFDPATGHAVVANGFLYLTGGRILDAYGL